MKFIKWAIIFLSLFVVSCYHINYSDKKSELLFQADSLYFTWEYSAAVTPAMQLLELAREDGDHYLCGQAEDLLADIIAATYGGHEVVEHRLNAADHYLQADSVRAHRYALLDVAIAHANNDSLRLGMSLLDSIRSIAGSDSALTANCLRASMRITARLDGLREFDSRKLKQYRRFFTPTAADYAYLAISKSTMKAKAEHYRHAMPEIAAEIEAEPADYGLYLDSARAIARTESEYKLIDWATAECYRNAGEPELWKSYTDSLCEQRLYARQPTASETVVGAQRDFQSDRATEQHSRASSLRTILICVTLLFIVIVAAGYAYYRLRMKVKNAEIEAQMESLANLSNEIARRHASSSAMNTRIENLFRERWQTINFLCNEFFEKGDSEKTRAFIIKEVENEIERLKTPLKLRQIEASVDECMDSIASRLRSQCATMLKEDDIRFIVLIYAGFSPRAVCMFTGMKLKSFYTKRTRLITRISSSEAIIDRDEFLQKLNATS